MPTRPPDRAPGTRWLAVLSTDHPPADPVKLVTADATAADALGGGKAGFTPRHHYAGLNALLGTLRLPDATPRPVCTAHAVQRGKRGSKPPETLFILDTLPTDFPGNTQVEARGVLKAVARAVRALCGERAPVAADWWLAMELARRGHVRRGQLVAAAGEAALATALDSPCLVPADNLLVWDEYVHRQAGLLAQEITKGKRNPFLTRLDPGIVISQLQMTHRGVAALVVRAIADRHGLATGEDELGPNAVLAGDLAPPLPGEADATARETIMAALEQGGVPGRRGLLKLVPSQPHVVAWLFAAEHLKESPDGFIFTRDQLTGWLAELRRAGLDPAQAGVRDLKDHLGLDRRTAEALRAWLVETSG